MRLFATLLFGATAFAASSPVPHLVKDLTPERDQVDAQVALTQRVVGDVFYFGTTSPAAGLWRTDGSAVGTYRVDNDAPGPMERLWQPMLNKDGVLYYPVDTWAGSFLYHTDGTTPGTQRIAQLPVRLREMALCADGKVCFVAEDHQIGVTDGTAAGTSVLRSSAPGVPETNLRRYLTSMGGKVYFNAYDDEAGQCVYYQGNYLMCGELWTSDGTTAGTHLFKDLVPGGWPSSPANLFANNGKLYFNAFNPILGTDCRVWVSDGTADGTRVLLPDQPNDCNFGARFFDFRGATYIATANSKIFRTDGTPEGTRRLVDILGWSDPVEIFLMIRGGDEMLIGRNGAARELWSFNGEHAVKLGSAPPPGEILGYLPATKRIYHVIGSGQGAPKELWSFDGTVHEKVWQFPTASIATVAPWGGTRGFIAFLVGGSQGWVTDGTAAGTQRLDLTSSVGQHSYPKDFLATNDKVYFNTNGPGVSSFNVTDGTAAGTIPLAQAPAFSAFSEEGRVYFRGESGYLWTTDGTPAGTRSVTSWFGVQERIYDPPAFIGETAVFQTGNVLARRDPGGTVEMLGLTGQMSGFRTAGSEVLFWTWDETTKYSVRATDGTKTGTRTLVSELESGGRAARFLPDGSRAFFGAKPKGGGSEWLWITNLTAAGTQPVKEISATPDDTLLPELVWRGAAFFRVGRPGESSILWRTDGTAAGTVPLSNTPFRQVTDSGDHLTLVSYDYFHNFEIWTSDGTPAGTTRRRMGKGAVASTPFRLPSGGIAVALVADLPPAHGPEVEIYNVTTGSSTFVPLGALRLGSGFHHLNGQLFFSATRPRTGYELWAIPLDGDQPVEQPEIRIAYRGLARVNGARAAVFRVTMETSGFGVPTVVASTLEGTLREGRDFTPFVREIRFENDNDVTLVVPVRPDVGGTVSIALSSPVNARIVEGFATAVIPEGIAKRRAARH